MATVTKAATGRYSVVFDEPYGTFLGLTSVYDTQGTVAGQTVEIYTGYVASTGTIVLSTTTGAAEANPASGVVLSLIFTMAS